MSSTVAKSGVMSSKLVHNAYGKSAVRLTKVIRNADSQELKEMSASIQLEGDFEESYFSGDNAKVVATDSMKNTVYCLASDHAFVDIESFGVILAKHFLDKYSHVTKATASIVEDLWLRIPYEGKDHPHSFLSAGNEKRITTVVASSKNGITIESGLERLNVAKTTNSQFWGFIRDEFTTLTDTKDRIFATAIEARWTYNRERADFNQCYTTARRTILEVFARHESLAVQQTLLAMGDEILQRVAEIEEITITMPNQHRLAFNLEPLGRKNKNEIFYPVSEPFGLITGTMKRKDKE